ncbi:MAG: Glycosyl transferase, group 2 family [Candidatus Roizmanbacteria bacterium GW2011_GWA2_34_18]|uniref:Glycosyl transferase, group 2 family n=1 Tax=Candidatus Roizmanbacteria bacterium GW2011_GWA2_34_18 TaxID=1618477 RepID=A0A0G0AQV2_9BACT|nr:MAG: Glycosyl transferase, group 2 family [Candidatus Roizmanbacteria bacterium GW2011_GWA2_34_18]
MSAKLSVLMITKNAAETLEKSLASVKKIADEIIIVDSKSTDRTVEIAKNYLAKVYVKEFSDIGKQRIFGLSKATGKWILILDCDEIVSKNLMKEIKSKIENTRIKINGYYISYQNFYLNKPLQYGGEDYKMLRFFRRVKLSIKPSLVHNRIEVKDQRVGYLKGKIFHHSYRSFLQMFKKFTDYGIRMAREKYLTSEKSSLKKVFLYPPHLFWARFIKDKGYEDGLFRIPLDLGFAYMEMITYVFLFYYSIVSSKIKSQKSK